MLMQVALPTLKLTNWKKTYGGDDLQFMKVAVATRHQLGSQSPLDS